MIDEIRNMCFCYFKTRDGQKLFGSAKERLGKDKDDTDADAVLYALLVTAISELESINLLEVKP